MFLFPGSTFFFICDLNNILSVLLIAAEVFWLSFCVSPPFVFSVSVITRHQVCTGGLWEAVQTNHWPGFLSEENKPSR